MADTDRIKRNLGKMIDAGAPEADINGYLATEGFNSPDAWRAASSGGAEKPFLDRAGNYVKGALKSAGQGLTLGFADEIGSAIDATIPGRELINKVRPVSQAENWQQRYDENLARERGEAKQFKEENPGTTTTANIAGNVGGAYALAGAPVVGGLFRGGKSLLGSVLRGAGAGGALAGAQGFGEGEGGVENRAVHSIIPAAIGVGVGGLAPVVGKAIGYGYEKYAPGLINKAADFADRFSKQVVPKSLSAAAPEGGMVTQEGVASNLADALRGSAGNIEGDAATKRLAQELARSGGTRQATERLGDLGEGAFLADTSKGATRLANLGAILPGEAGDKYASAFSQRNAQTGQRFLNAMGEEANVPSVFDAQQFLTKYRSAQGKEIYDPVLRQGQFNVSPEMDELLKVPAIREAMDKVIKDGAEHGVDVGAAEAAHMVKQQLNQNTDAAFQSGKAINKDFVRQAGDAWEQALWSANPAIKEADTAYAKVASLHNPNTGEGWLKRGGDFMKSGQGEAAVNVSPSALAADLPGATPQQLQTFRVGSSNVMRDAAMSGPESTRRLGKAITDNEIMQQKLTEIYGPEVTQRLIKSGQAERAFAETQGKVIAGSQTAERMASLADEAMLTAPPNPGGGDLAAMWNWLKTTGQKVAAPNAGTRSRLADLLANPDPAANAETLALVDALLKRQSGARPFSAGVAGSAGGSYSNP